MNYNFDKVLRDAMPVRKIKHSKRVMDRLINLPDDAKYAALFHDYLERGGDVSVLKNILPERSIELVRLLTIDNNDSPLKHVRNVLSSGLDENLANFLILIKIADRKDNYNKRIKSKCLSKKYKRKTKELLEFLIATYSGPKGLLKDALK